MVTMGYLSMLCSLAGESTLLLDQWTQGGYIYILPHTRGSLFVVLAIEVIIESTLFKFTIVSMQVS